MKWMHHIATAATAAGVLLMWACAGADVVDTSTPYEGPVNSCATDADCRASTCHPELEICALDPSVESTIYAKVIPGQTTNLPVQIFQLPMETTDDLELRIQAPVPVSGITPDMDGRVLFLDQINILPGRDSNISVYPSIAGTSTEFLLLPGTYNVSILPEGLDGVLHPVLYIDNVVVDEKGTFRDINGEEIVIDLPEDQTIYDDITGTVAYQSPEEDLIPANGMRVVAKDPITGRIVSTEDVSECVTESDCGRFNLRLRPGLVGYRIEVTKPSEPFYPTIFLDVDPSTIPDELTIPLPMPSVPVVLHAKVEVEDESTLGRPAPLCQFLFELGADATRRKLERWATSNESGEIEETEGVLGVHLYPDTYRLTVLPISGSGEEDVQYSSFVSDEISTSGSGDISETGGEVGPFVIPLTERNQIAGSVLIEKETVPSVSLRAEPLLGEPITVRGATAISDPQGAFQMWADVGAYHVVAEAPLKSRYAWGSATWGISDDEDVTYTVSLKIPFVVFGTVVLPPPPEGTTHTPKDTIIEWYRLSENRAFQIGRAVVDADGNFTALLPSS